MPGYFPIKVGFEASGQEPIVADELTDMDPYRVLCCLGLHMKNPI